MPLLIETVQPQLVGGVNSLLARLTAEGQARGLSKDQSDGVIAILPPNLAACGCFLDRLTNIWRYEFGLPHRVGNDLIWGVHMWPRVPLLFDVLECAQRRLSPDKLCAYLTLIDDIGRHLIHLTEMFPMLRVSPVVPADHEVGGLGAGNRTVDWVVDPAGERRVLVDVKRRFADFFSQMEGVAVDGGAAPQHDIGLLFRSVEGKFLPRNSADQLQGAWIVTDIKQEETELQTAFDALDPAKVHFAILGDERADVCLLTRGAEHRRFLLELFGVQEKNERFLFRRGQVRT
ncbi:MULTISPECIES: hypothetical protein [Bradyrhizobium]|uniref:Uncharacterized protein n=1 Tax=Bradyrhizobium elkanii TaxID=29448 RepID=A0A4V6Y7A1_BRAEL|nr:MULTISPECIES: hypothetical protein [Bradyrhizobium]MTV16323.1 hypothetical protein [Bradyrhizobium sp. BR2003]TKV77905.1 hypothetical protein FDV58_29020 [Bradyrhizobium elkanii]